MTDNDRPMPGGKIEPLRPARPCPECGRTSTRADYPFCSRRCRDIDLNRWLSGRYAIPASDEDEQAGGEGADGEDRGR